MKNTLKITSVVFSQAPPPKRRVSKQCIRDNSINKYHFNMEVLFMHRRRTLHMLTDVSETTRPQAFYVASPLENHHCRAGRPMIKVHQCPRGSWDGAIDTGRNGNNCILRRQIIGHDTGNRTYQRQTHTSHHQFQSSIFHWNLCL